MPPPRVDQRDPAHPKYGKPGVSYPYGDLRFPRIVEAFNSRKAEERRERAFLSPHRDKLNFPGALLITQNTDKGSDVDQNATAVYETLPGPIFSSEIPDAELGIPVMTTSQQRASTDSWTSGQIAPISFNISGATVAAQTVVTLSGYPTIPDIFVGEWVVIVSTANTTPSLDGTWKVMSVDGAAITLNKQITNVSGAVGGTCRRYSYAYVERRKTENTSVVEMVTTRAATDDITRYNETTKSVERYPFPDALIDIIEYLDTANTSTVGNINYSYSWSGGIGFKILPGYRGGCAAHRLRVFSMGPFTSFPTDPNTGQEYAPTVVIPAVGTVKIQGGSLSRSIHWDGALPDITNSTSNSFKSHPIPPVLTSAYTAPTVVGAGQAVFHVDLPDSIVKDPGSAARKGFAQGDIIIDFEESMKLRGIGVYTLTIKQIVCPYTTGVGPA